MQLNEQRKQLILDYVQCFEQIAKKVENVQRRSPPMSPQYRVYNTIRSLVHEGMLSEQAELLRGSVTSPPAHVLLTTFMPSRFQALAELINKVNFHVALGVMCNLDNLPNYLNSADVQEQEFACRLHNWLYEL